MREGVRERGFERVQRSVLPLSVAVYACLLLLILASIWGERPAMFGCVALFAFEIVFNIPVCNWLWARLGHSLVSGFRTLVNAAVMAVAGHLTHWQLPMLCCILTMGTILGATRRPHALWYALVFASVLPLAAFAEGVAARDVLTLGIAIMGMYFLAYRASAITPAILDELDAQNQELKTANALVLRLQQAAIQNEKLAGLGLLAAGIAHEINNPMSYISSNIVGLLADLRRAEGLPESLREYADEILPETIEGITRVNSIVGDLKQFARGGKEPMRTYDLTREIERALRMAQSEFGDRCTVELALGEVPTLLGRPEQIGQVMVNLLVNAAQADAHTIRVQTEVVSGAVQITVADTGAGIDEETCRHIFDPFFTTKGPGHGTGLGLSIIHGIVQSHGGDISVHSEVGKGSCFTIRLPLAAT